MNIVNTRSNTVTSTTKEITSFYLTTPAAIGTIAGTNISLTVPFGTSLTGLAPTISHNGTLVSPANGTPQNFSSPVTYTVTAQDGTTQSYTVTVTTAANTASTTKEITSFYLASPAAIGTIAGTNISLIVPFGTSLTGLTPTISHNGTSVSPSNGTPQNFSSPVTYTVTAQDGTTQSYTVTVTTSASNQVATPTFSVAPGTYYTDQTVSISCSESNAYIYYTTNGSEPTPASTYYSSPILIAGNGTVMTIKAIVTKSGMTNSSIASGTWTIDKTVPTVSISTIPTPYISGNTGAINSKNVNWSSNRNGSYTVRLGGSSCSDGSVLFSGTATSGVTNTETIQASSLSIGTNTMRVCVVDSITSQTGSNTTTLTRDDTAPTVTATPGTTSSATAINVSLACSDASSGCDKIVYTSNGTDPTMTGSSITNGTQYSSQLTPPDNATTTYKYIARDNASSVSSSTYTVDTSVATVSVNSVTPSSTIVNGTTNPVINWQATEGGTYTIKIGGTNCTNGTLATGMNVSGSYTSGSVSTTINNSALSGGVNTVRLCVENLVGNYGSTTQSITKDTTAPVAGNSGTITTASVTSTGMTLNWTKATDNVTAQGSLQYKVVRSLSNNISSVATAESNGTVVQDWATDIATVNVTSLTAGTTYYFNVLVKDGVDNKGIYGGKSQATLPLTYTIGGTVSGLTASGLVLQNNGGNNLTVASGATSFVFSTSVNNGSSYIVTVATQPTGRGCTVTNGSGTVSSANVTNVAINCFTAISETYTWGTFTDNFNGTVKFVGNSGTYGGNSYTAQTLTFMKCSQGQSWNSGTNSCDGTAGTYQYCPTNDNACDNGTILTSGPAYTTCNTLSFAGKGAGNWRVPTKNELKTLIHCTNKTMPADFNSCSSYTAPSVNNLFPNTIANGYWSSTAYSPSSNVAWVILFSLGGTGYGNKDGLSYVRCVSGL